MKEEAVNNCEEEVYMGKDFKNKKIIGIQMNDYNIEFAHIYADQMFGEEQHKSIAKLKTLIKRLQQKKKSFTTTLLIDEYNSKSYVLQEIEFLQEIKEQGVQLDFLAYESTLTTIAEKVIRLIPKKLIVTHKFKDREVKIFKKRDKMIGLKDSHGKHTCSLLITAWILTRFGIYPLPSLQKLSRNSFRANRLITILPKKYHLSERKAIDILKTTKYKSLISKMDYIFF